jgi:hypothetical protein
MASGFEYMARRQADNALDFLVTLARGADRIRPLADSLPDFDNPMFGTFVLIYGHQLTPQTNPGLTREMQHTTPK